MPEEIKKIREQYGLSQRSFAKLLNWGDKTICRYENGFKGFDYEKLCAMVLFFAHKNVELLKTKLMKLLHN